MWTLSIHEENKTCLSVSTDHNRGNATLLLNSKHNYFILWLYYTREWMSMGWDSIVIDTKESECLKTLIRWKEVDKFSRKRKKKKKKRTNEHSRNYILALSMYVDIKKRCCYSSFQLLTMNEQERVKGYSVLLSGSIQGENSCQSTITNKYKQALLPPINNDYYCST